MKKLGSLDKIYLGLRVLSSIIVWFYALAFPFYKLSFLGGTSPSYLALAFSILFLVVALLLVFLPKRHHLYLYLSILPFDLLFISVLDRTFGAPFGLFYLGYFAVAIFYALYFDFAVGFGVGILASLIYLLNNLQNLINLGAVSIVNTVIKALFIGGVSFTVSYIVRRKKQEALSLQFKELTEKLPIIDEVTGLYNSSYLKHRLKKELKRAERYGSSLSFALMKIKTSQQEEDASFITSLMKSLRKFLRASDIVGTYESRKFGLILAETDASGAFIAAQRIRKKFVEELLKGAEEKVEINLGVASYPVHAANFKELLEEANFALAQAEETRSGVFCPSSKVES